MAVSFPLHDDPDHVCTLPSSRVAGEAWRCPECGRWWYRRWVVAPDRSAPDIAAMLRRMPRPGPLPLTRLRRRRMTTGTVRLRYLVAKPDTGGERLPLLLSLHGGAEGGDDLDAVAGGWLCRLVEQGAPLPFLLVVPQCPEGPEQVLAEIRGETGRAQAWSRYLVDLIRLVDEVARDNPVSLDSVYVIGHSMGASGALALAAARPGRIAAVVPLAGGGDARTAPALAAVPLWAFHGELDRTVPVARSREILDAVLAAGGDARLTVLPGVGHSCTPESHLPELWSWLLAQRRHL